MRDAVGQMVRQFADPLAFYRELVQNSLDAGATAITVHFDWEGDARGTLDATVTDDGAGMTQETIERALLVLFRSTKEGDPSKIGRFGVGFFSVFAAGPQEVRVHTGHASRPDALRLRLRPDFTWELESWDVRRGTAVTLCLAMARDDARAFVARSVEALRRWCPHVAVPLTVEASNLAVAGLPTRVDRPFEAAGLMGVVQRIGNATYALAVAPRASSAFYNRGILLHASDEAIVSNVAVALDAPDLHHTLSRDNVRRDEVFERLVARAHGLAAGPLTDALVAAIHELAPRVAAARHEEAVHVEASRLLALLEAAFSPPFRVDANALVWPLVAPVAVDGTPRAAWNFTRKGWFRADEVRVASGRTRLALALARRGLVVIDLGFAGADVVARVRGVVGAASGGRARDVATRYCLPCVVAPAAYTPAERRGMARLDALFAAVSLLPARLGEPVGVGADRAWVSLDARADLDDPSLVVDAEREALTLAAGRCWVLHRAHPRVVAAFSAGDVDAALYALARAALLDAGMLDARRDGALLMAVVAEAVS